MKKRDIGLVIVCLFAFIYASVWVHVFLKSRAEMRRGDALQAKIPDYYRTYAKLIPLKERDLLSDSDKENFEQVQYDYFQSVVKTVTAFDNCLHYYTPFNEYLPRAAEALISVGDDCLNKGEFHLALSAYRTARISPEHAWVKSADEKIKATYARMERIEASKR